MIDKKAQKEAKDQARKEEKENSPGFPDEGYLLNPDRLKDLPFDPAGSVTFQWAYQTDQSKA